MGDLAKLKIWDDPAIGGALSWYLDVAENRRPAKFRIAATVATQAISKAAALVGKTRLVEATPGRAVAVIPVMADRRR